jgi:hypothetical protein
MANEYPVNGATSGGCRAGVIMGDGTIVTLEDEPDTYPVSVHLTGAVQH